MKTTKNHKAPASKNGPAKKRGVVSKATRFVGDHPKSSAAGVLAAAVAGVGAYALLRGGKSKRKNAASKARRGTTARRTPVN